MTDHGDEFDRSLSERLRAYEDRIPSTAAPILATVGSGPPARTRAAWRWGAVVGTGGVAAGLILVLMWSGRFLPPTGQATATPHPSSSIPTPSATGVPSLHPCGGFGGIPASSADPSSSTSSPRPSSDMWEVAAIHPEENGAGSQATYAGLEWFDGLGWLVYGIEADGRAGLWISRDGVSWDLATSPTPPDGQGYRVVDVVKGVVGGCIRMAAVGQRAVLRDGFWGSTGPSFVLFSDDGLTWALSPSVPSTATQLSGVTAIDAGFVAIGTRSAWPAESGERQDARVWLSSDAETWSEFAPPELAKSIPLGIDTLAGVVIATGFADRSSPPQMAWRSTDGMTWEAHVALPPQSQGCVCEVADADDGLIVMVGVGENGAYASQSNDGRAWAAEPLSDQFAGPTGLDIRDGAVVVSGFENRGDAPSENFVWVREAGGSRWRSVPWRDHVVDNLEDQFIAVAFLDIAMNGSHTAILTGDGRVLLTAGPRP
jgi:hypothetical protein